MAEKGAAMFTPELLKQFEGGQARIASNFGRSLEPITLLQVLLTCIEVHENILNLAWKDWCYIDFGGKHQYARGTCTTIFTVRAESSFPLNDKLVVACAEGTKLELIPAGHPDCLEFTTSVHKRHESQAL